MQWVVVCSIQKQQLPPPGPLGMTRHDRDGCELTFSPLYPGNPCKWDSALRLSHPNGGAKQDPVFCLNTYF